MGVAYVRADTLYAWKGPSLLITTPRGECGDDHPLTGFYYREARILRTLRIEINGVRPWLAEAAAPAPDRLEFTYVHPEISEYGGGGTGQSGDEEGEDDHGLPERSLVLRLVCTAGAGALDIALVVANHARRQVEFELTCVLGADFADIQEALAFKRQQSAPVHTSADGASITFEYEHSKLAYRTDITGTGWSAETAPAARVKAAVVLQSQESKTFTLQVHSTLGAEGMSPEAAQDRERALERWTSRFAIVHAPGSGEYERVLRRNIRDVGSFPTLDGEPDEWLALQAGMPAYPAFFGRDAVTAGWQTAMLDCGEALDAALTRLGRTQSSRFDDWRDEQPGRIPYQMRGGPLALLNINPYSAYYADFASPLMYVIALANLYAWTGDRRVLERHWDTARRILDWAREHGDADRDGYLEYQTRSSKGTKNQGWKDSGDAIVYDDGSPVPPPIATCELQGYWFIAQELMGVLSAVMDSSAGDSAAFLRSAADLKRRFNRDWWMPDEQFFALALDPEKRQVRAVTSNVGHCLATGIIDEAHRAAVVGRMFATDLYSGWGIRTLSASHAFYNPMSYHRGTVWAVEQGTIIFGLRRFGFTARALDLTRAMFDLALLYPEDRIPECVGGYARGEYSTPGAYPRANTPQLWNATAFPLAVQSMLGLLPLAPADTLIVDPVLPTWMPEIVVRNLRVGQASVSIRFWRDKGGSSKWDVLHKHGTLHVVRQPPPEARSVDVIDRVKALAESVAS